MAKASTFAYKGSTALITGAFGGLGQAFAEQLAAKGCSRLVLVGRSEAKLQELAQRLERQSNVTTTVLTADFASNVEVDQLISTLETRNIHVDLLVNNAGFGVFQKFLETPLDRQMEQVDVNVRALVSLTHALTPAMVARNTGGVINLSSSAGFQPVPGANIYAASKSFVLLFSEALAQELVTTRVRVLAVCPGPVATGFFADKNPDLARDQMDDPNAIVAESLRAFDRGKRVLVPGKLSVRLAALSSRLFPRAVVARFGESVARKLNHA
jgi:short-subunit dehydrogenase